MFARCQQNCLMTCLRTGLRSWELIDTSRRRMQVRRVLVSASAFNRRAAVQRALHGLVRGGEVG